jgi:hypothetical protein
MAMEDDGMGDILLVFHVGRRVRWSFHSYPSHNMVAVLVVRHLYTCHPAYQQMDVLKKTFVATGQIFCRGGW